MADPTDTVLEIPVDDVRLEGALALPPESTGLVAFAHGSGSSRKSPRNRFVAEELRSRGLGTLLFDLLTEAEDRSRANRFDIERLTRRLLGVTEWLRERPETETATLGYFGSSTGAAAALGAAARRDDVAAVASRGGRVDLAPEELSAVTAPTLLVVGGADTSVLERNRDALDAFTVPADLAVVEGAGHLFEGPGELEAVAERAAAWFETRLA